jgi:hypothetical protein
MRSGTVASAAAVCLAAAVIALLWPRGWDGRSLDLRIPADRRVRTVEKVDVRTLSLERFYREYATARKPVVITGAADILGMRNWNLDLIDRLCGSRKVCVPCRVLACSWLTNRLSFCLPMQ